MTDQSETPGGPAAGNPFGNGPQQKATWAARALERVRDLLRLEVKLLLALALLYLGFSIADPDIFISGRMIENLARQAGVLLVVSVGQMMVLGENGFWTSDVAQDASRVAWQKLVFRSSPSTSQRCS